MADLNFTGNIRRLRLRPGDYIVLEAPENTTMEQVAWIRDAVRAKFPDNEVMILGGGLRAAAVMKPEEVACG